MAPIMPAVPEPRVDKQLQAIRALSKLVYLLVPPQVYCRPNSNRTLEGLIFQALHSNVSAVSIDFMCPEIPSIIAPPNRNTTNPSASGLPFSILSHTFSSFIPSMTQGVIQGLIPAPVLKHSPSPSASTSPSRTPSPSVSPTVSPSSPVQMCGNVRCDDLGISVHMYARVPPGWCSLCLDGTSGPCRDPSTLACHDYDFGNQCHNRYFRCADHDGSVHSNVIADCPERTGDHFEVFATISVPTTGMDDWVNVWGRTLTSAIADTLDISNTCDVKLISAQQSDEQSAMTLSVSLARIAVDEANLDLNNLNNAIANGSLMTSFSRHGVPVNTAESLSLLSARVAGIIAI